MKKLRVLMPEVKEETAKAWGFSLDDRWSTLAYFPKSLCSLEGDALTMPEWLAKKTGAIHALKSGQAEWVS